MVHNRIRGVRVRLRRVLPMMGAGVGFLGEGRKMGKVCANDDVRLNEWEKSYHQPPDDSTQNDQRLTVRQEDAGAGPYWIISTPHWAFNDIEELIEMLEHAGVQHRTNGRAR